MTSSGKGKTYNAQLPTDSTINVDKAWHICVEAVFAPNSAAYVFGAVVGCSGQINLKPTIDIIKPELTESLTFHGGDIVDIEFHSAMLGGDVDILLCLPSAAKCDVTLKKAISLSASAVTTIHKTTIVIPTTKDVPAKAGYQIQVVSTTKATDAVAKSVVFKIASKFQITVEGLTSISKTIYRGGNKVSAPC